MKITCLASGSTGNCYIIKSENTILMLEAGITLKTITQRLFTMDPRIILTDINAVVVTHMHGDHARAVKEMSIYAPIVASPETLDHCNIKIHRMPVFPWQKNLCIGNLQITPFDVDHDCAGAYGYIIYDSIEDERLLFVNDTKFIKYDFSKMHFDYVMIECNHNNELLNRDDWRIVRTAQAHQSLETVMTELRKFNLEKTKAIYLMHLSVPHGVSPGNADEKLMVKSIQEISGIPVYACLQDGGFSNG
ncbi:MAG: MBL fold metallo-hydrolase [Candidatus Izemoplasmatales bacterium]|jgi:phosphoribosyl 1,2-cyclic phosphodiesterase